MSKNQKSDSADLEEEDGDSVSNSGVSEQSESSAPPPLTEPIPEKSEAPAVPEEEPQAEPQSETTDSKSKKSLPETTESKSKKSLSGSTGSKKSKTSLPGTSDSKSKKSLPETTESKSKKSLSGSTGSKKSKTSLPGTSDSKSKKSLPETTESKSKKSLSGSTGSKKSKTSLPETTESKSKKSLSGSTGSKKSKTSLPETTESKSKKSLSGSTGSKKSQKSLTKSIDSKSQPSLPESSDSKSRNSMAKSNESKSKTSLPVEDEGESGETQPEDEGAAMTGADEGGEDEAEEDTEEQDDEEEEESEPQREIVPLGEATEETLLEDDMHTWVLEKMYHQGSMGRLNADGARKLAEGGSQMYEDYKWQLEKLYRHVPEEMSLGTQRLKPDEFLYEGENFILGKLFRTLREEDGYVPTAEKEESLIDLSAAIPIPSLPPEPQPCPAPTYPEPDDMEDECGRPAGDRACTQKITSPTGKVYEFAYSGITAVTLESDVTEGEDAGGCMENMPAPITPYKSNMAIADPSRTSSTCSGEGGPSSTLFDVRQSAKRLSSTSEKRASLASTSEKGACGGAAYECKPRCESHIAAIYDTLTGCDNYPCNMCDKPQEDNIEDDVWSWFFQLICPSLDSNSNVMLDKENSADKM